MKGSELLVQFFPRFLDYVSRKCSWRIALLAPLLLLSGTASRADVYYITFYDLTFSATCIGGGTCTETINGTGFYDAVAQTASALSVQMSGTLNASLDGFGSPACGNPVLCLTPPVLYDSNALPSFNPIELAPTLPTFDASTPQPLEGGPDGTVLFVPGMCGGDQPLCNTAGAFPGGARYQLTSGTYTSVDVSAPEPGAVILASTGLLLLVGLAFRNAASSRSPRVGETN